MIPDRLRPTCWLCGEAMIVRKRAITAEGASRAKEAECRDCGTEWIAGRKAGPIEAAADGGDRRGV